MKTKFVLAVLLFLISGYLFCPFINAGEIYFGVSLGHDLPIVQLDSSILNPMRQSLGFNNLWACSGNLTTDRLNYFSSLGYQVVPYLTIADDPLLSQAFTDYLHAYYAVIQAEDDTLDEDVCFRTKNGYSDGNWYAARDSVVNDTARVFIFLDNLFFNQERQYTSDTTQYRPFIRMRVDVDSVPSGVTLAYLRVWGIDSTDQWGGINETIRHHRLIKEYPILSNLFPNGRTPYEIQFDSTFTIPDTIREFTLDSFGNLVKIDTSLNIPEMVLTYQIVSTGQLPFAVDSFAVYNQNGFNVMTGLNDNTFSYYISSNPPAVDWLLRDDMHYDQLLPARHLDSLINQYSGYTKHGIMKPFFNAFYGPYAYDSALGGRFTFRDFVRLAHPKIFAPNSYPFYGTAGFYGSEQGGLQERIFSSVTDPLDSIMPLLAANNTELWYGGQGQTEQVYSTQYYNFRRPTGPEFSMEAFIAIYFSLESI